MPDKKSDLVSEMLVVLLDTMRDKGIEEEKILEVLKEVRFKFRKVNA